MFSSGSAGDVKACVQAHSVCSDRCRNPSRTYSGAQGFGKTTGADAEGRASRC